MPLHDGWYFSLGLTDFISVRSDATVGDAVARMRRSDLSPRQLTIVCVVDERGCLAGVVSLVELLRAGKVPADRVAALRAAFNEMVADPEFLAEADKLKLIVTPMTGGEVTRHVAELYATPAELVARAKGVTGE